MNTTSVDRSSPLVDPARAMLLPRVRVQPSVSLTDRPQGEVPSYWTRPLMLYAITSHMTPPTRHLLRSTRQLSPLMYFDIFKTSASIYNSEIGIKI